MREIVFDTETTGFEPGDGHRIVEIGCVELMDHFPTGRTFQAYLNPERDVPIESQRVHGLSAEFLADKPLFAAVAEEFLEFIGDAPLVIHNASFDIKFINAELARTGHPPIPLARAIDTIEIAKRKLPGRALFAGRIVQALRRRSVGAQPSMARCWTRELTAQIYLELIGGRQRGLMLAPVDIAAAHEPRSSAPPASGPQNWRRASPTAELALHVAFVAKELGDDAALERLGADQAVPWRLARAPAPCAPGRAPGNRSARSSGAACRRRAPHRRRCGGQRGTACAAPGSAGSSAGWRSSGTFVSRNTPA